MYWNHRNIRFVSCLVTFLSDIFNGIFCFPCFHIDLIGILYNLYFCLSIPFLYFLKALTFFNISQRLPAKKCRVQARIRAQRAKGTHCKTLHKSENQNQNRRIFSQKGLVPVCFCEKMCTIHTKSRLHRAHTP